MSGVRCQVSGVRCQVSGVRCQVSGVRCQVSGLRSQVSGLRSPVSGQRPRTEERKVSTTDAFMRREFQPLKLKVPNPIRDTVSGRISILESWVRQRRHLMAQSFSR